jgi:hypothetical protein
MKASAHGSNQGSYIRELGYRVKLVPLRRVMWRLVDDVTAMRLATIIAEVGCVIQ